MKKALAVLILLVLVGVSVSAQETVDVVYLTDGQVITGKIIETEKYPENRIKIQTEDGTVYIVKMADVEKIVEQTAEGAAVTVALDTGDDQPMSRSYINVNLLGFLQWGPIVEYGFSVAEDLYLAPSPRRPGRPELDPLSRRYLDLHSGPRTNGAILHGYQPLQPEPPVLRRRF